jgi:hypothetical protein
MLFVFVTALMTFAAFMLAVYLGLKGRWFLAANCLICFFILISPSNVVALSIAR